MKPRVALRLVFFFIFIPVFIFSQPREQGALLIDGIPEIPARILPRLQQYQNVRSASFADWHPSGAGMLINTRFAETNQIHYVAMPGGARQQLTFFNETVFGGAYHPGKEREGFLFSLDAGGAENYQFYFYDQPTGQNILLTDGKSRNTGPRWSHRGGRVAFTSTLRNGRDFDLRLLTLAAPGTSELLKELSGSWSIIDWSPDDRQLLISQFLSANESYLHIFDLATKTLTPVNPKPEQKISYGSAAWSADGKSVYYASDELGEFQQLTHYDLAAKKKTVLTNTLLWEVEAIEVAPNGRWLAFTANEAGLSKLHVLSPVTRQELTLPSLPAGLISGLKFNHDGSELAFTMNTAQTPGDIYSLVLSGLQLKRWTFSEVGGLNAENFVAPTLVHYPTFDQEKNQPRRVPAFYYKPKNASGKTAVIISIHGGPEGQSRPGFSSLYQYWVNEMGIAVLLPNVRGSTGYGKTYLALDNGYKREESVQDIGALLDWIAQQPELDAKRVGVYGGSYGGYMVLAALTHYNDRIKAGVESVGISNFVTFLESTQAYRRDLRRAEYGDERDPKMREFLLKISPMTNAAKITKPLLVAQGANDPRVPLNESNQIVKTIRGNGGEVWYVVAKDEGHGFQKKSNRDYWLNAMTLFWETHLLDRKGSSD